MDNKDMLKFAVGEEFPLPPQTEEGITFSIEPYTMLLIYRFRHPNEQEKRAFATGDVSFGVTELRQTLFILSRFAPLAWMDTPYSTHLSSTVKSFPDLRPGQGYAIDAFLVDCADNKLLAHRLIHLDTHSSEKLRSLVMEEQARTDFDQEKYHQAVEEVYRSYSPRDLVKLATIMTKIKKK
ncbi:MAG: hypothetical protein IJM90_08920 [Firmicutes bacterium]|nr:hypothetical protein [Bacillota bacterium]